MNTIWLIGCGKMGKALLIGWIKSQVVKNIIVVEPENLIFQEHEKNGLNVTFINKISELINFGKPNAVVLAVKPQIIDIVLLELKCFLGEFDLLISIAAGIKTKHYEKKLGKKISIIRAMPNTPASVGKGVSVIVKNQICNLTKLNQSKLLLGDIGEVIELRDEKLMDAVTAISGSGPAYFFYMVEALINAGIKIGLEKNLAYKLASLTFSGSGFLAKDSNVSFIELRKSVTSPGGTTEAGLKKLTKDKKLFKLIEETVEAAQKRGLELGNK